MIRISICSAFLCIISIAGGFCFDLKKMKELLLSPEKKTVLITSKGFLGGMTKNFKPVIF